MNALVRATARTAIPRATAPMQAANRRNMVTWTDFKKNWLSDPGAYPVIGILGIAVTGCTAYGTSLLLFGKDVQWAPSKRQSILRTWGH